jgi:hypothetical protein
MLQHFLLGVGSVVVLSCLWLLVQRLWQRSFPEQHNAQQDALADRGGCYGCNCDAVTCNDPDIDNTKMEATSNAPARL